MKEKQDKGLIERFGYLSRNVEATVSAIALLFGHLGFAAAMGIGALIDHKIAKHFENKRIGKQEKVVFQAKPQTA